MIELTPEQRHDLKGPEPLAIDPETQQTYVLVPKERYDCLRQLFDQDVGLSKREVAALVERAMRDYDVDDPTLELYQHD